MSCFTLVLFFPLSFCYEIIIDFQKLAKKKKKRIREVSVTPTQFLPVRTSCVATVHYHNQEMDIATLYGAYFHFIRFIGTRLCVGIQLFTILPYAYICVTIPNIRIPNCSFTTPVPQTAFLATHVPSLPHQQSLSPDNRQPVPHFYNFVV